MDSGTRVALIRCAWLVLGLSVMPTPAKTQAITLPTVRTYGPAPEESMLHRVFSDLNARFARDTVAVRSTTNRDSVARDAAARRALHRIDRMLLAPVTEAQLERLAQVRDSLDSLVVLAETRAQPTDPRPLASLRALRRVSEDPEVCLGLNPADMSAVDAKVARQDSLSQRSVTQSERNKSRNVLCAIAELRERDPSLVLDAVLTERTDANDMQTAAKVDSLVRIATAVVVLRKLRTRLFAPLRSRLQAEAFWRQRGWAPLNVGSISGSGKAGTSFTELASPLLQMVRVSVNAVLAAEDPDEAEAPAAGALAEGDDANASVQRLMTGGGLFNVSFAWPLAYQSWGRGAVDVMTVIAPRFGLTAPILGATGADSSTINLDVGMEVHAKVLDATDGVGVMAQVRWANARGSRGFVESLGITNKSTVTYASASLGFLFGRQYLVTASKGIAGPRVIRTPPWQIGLTIVRLPAGS